MWGTLEYMSSRHVSHWGVYDAHRSPDGTDIESVTPWSEDTAPSALLGNVPGSVTRPSRVQRPAVRRRWWEHGPGPDRERGRAGSDQDWITPGWDEVLDRLADELRRVYRDHGAQAVFGGSYGWASAGRFHHAQSQLHRFLNTLGGYTRGVNTYSTGASEVLFPHILTDESALAQFASTWDVVAEHTETLIAFGGVPVKNTGIDAGGAGDHPTGQALDALHSRGTNLVVVSPLRDDLPGARWVPISPGTDTALMLAMTHVLLEENLADSEFLEKYCSGADTYANYILGCSDGEPKSARWAEEITGIKAEEIQALARLAAQTRTLVTVSWSLQRARHGEQPMWAALALAAHLGQIGLPGGGFASGYGSMNKPGCSPTPLRFPALPQGQNPVGEFIPVAKISDLLLHPGEEFTYDGGTYTYPDIRLVWWAGGNPFHHHQDLGRLTNAFTRPDTIIVSDPYWTSTARHADIVLPSTTTFERDDIGGARSGARLTPMRALVSRYCEARDDYDIYSALAERLEVGEVFTENRDAQEWLRHLYGIFEQDVTQGRITPPGMEVPELPSFEEFWDGEGIDLPRLGPIVAFEDFRTDPVENPLPTPSGRIELTSETIAALELPDCPGHPTWLAPTEYLGANYANTFPLLLLANQPAARLHSQLDDGATSVASKVAGREPIRLNPADAAARGIDTGDVVLVSNDRGACLAGAILSDAVRQNVVQLSTGAWFDPYDPQVHGPEAGQAGLRVGTCVHGNPNVLTADVATSGLSQGCTGQHVLVEVVRWDGPVPEVSVHEAPC